MEALILNKSFKLVKIIDAFSSFIWNDVYIGCGDFELEYPMNDNALAYIDEGYYVQIEQSDRTMIIEQIEIVTSFTEGNVARLSGRSLESILARRIIRNDILISGSLQDAILRALNENLINAENPNRNIEGFAVRLSTDQRILNMNIDAEWKAGDNLYSTILKVCEDMHLGFRITLHEERFFIFELYFGNDHSYDQNSNPWVVFSTAFENLEDSNMKIDTSNLYNCMEIDYTTTENIIDPINGNEETKVVVPIILGNDVTGIDRRETYGSSNFEVDKIDKAMFGKPEDLVNWYDYASWQKIRFNSSAYNRAMEEYNKEYSSHVSAAVKPRKVSVTYELKPGDPGYKDVSDTPGAEWVNTRTEERDETPEEAAKRSEAYVARIASHAPKKEDYEEWGWALDDRDGYNVALEEAQKKIDNEFKAAQEKALDYATALVARDGLEELSEYRNITSFNGKVDPNVNFIYRRDYNLGDVVQIVNQYHFNAKTRVVSVLFSQDNQNGIIVRPTFESDDVAQVEFDFYDETGGDAK